MSLCYDSDTTSYDLGYDTEPLSHPTSAEQPFAQHAPQAGPQVSYHMNFRVSGEGVVTGSGGNIGGNTGSTPPPAGDSTEGAPEAGEENGGIADAAADAAAAFGDFLGLETGEGTEGASAEGDKGKGAKGKKRRRSPRVLPKSEPTVHETTYHTTVEQAWASTSLMGEGLNGEEAAVYIKLNSPPKKSEFKGPEATKDFLDAQEDYTAKFKGKGREEVLQKMANQQVHQFLQASINAGVEGSLAYGSLIQGGHIDRTGVPSIWPPEDPFIAAGAPLPDGYTEDDVVVRAPKAKVGPDYNVVEAQKSVDQFEAQFKTKSKDDTRTNQQARERMLQESMISQARELWEKDLGYTPAQSDAMLQNLGLLGDDLVPTKLSENQLRHKAGVMFEHPDEGRSVVVDAHAGKTSSLRLYISSKATAKSPSYNGQDISLDGQAPELVPGVVPDDLAQAAISYIKANQTLPTQVGADQGGNADVSVSSETKERPKREDGETIGEYRARRQEWRQDKRDPEGLGRMGLRGQTVAELFKGGKVDWKLGGLDRDLRNTVPEAQARDLAFDMQLQAVKASGEDPDSFLHGPAKRPGALDGASRQIAEGDPKLQKALTEERKALMSGGMDANEAARYQAQHPNRSVEDVQKSAKRLGRKGLAKSRVASLKKDMAKVQAAEAEERKRMGVGGLGLSAAEIDEFQRVHAGRDTETIAKSFQGVTDPKAVAAKVRNELRDGMIADVQQQLVEVGASPEDAKLMARELYRRGTEIGALDDNSPVDQMVAYRKQVETDLIFINEDSEARVEVLKQQTSDVLMAEAISKAQATADPSNKKFYQDPQNAKLFFRYHGKMDSNSPSAWADASKRLESGGDLAKKIDGFPGDDAAKKDSSARQSFGASAFGKYRTPSYAGLTGKELTNAISEHDKWLRNQDVQDKKEARDRFDREEDKRQAKVKDFMGGVDQLAKEIGNRERQRRTTDRQQEMQSLGRMTTDEVGKISEALHQSAGISMQLAQQIVTQNMPALIQAIMGSLFAPAR